MCTFLFHHNECRLLKLISGFGGDDSIGGSEQISTNKIFDGKIVITIFLSLLL